jgi:hypothetical protein
MGAIGSIRIPKDGVDGVNGKDGVDGVNGKDGVDGVNGKDGSNFLSGQGVPADTLGNDGDTYLDTSAETLNFFKKENGTWL